MTPFDAPEQLKCLRRQLRLVNLTEICPMHDNEQFKVPCFISGCTKAQNNNQSYN